VYASIGIWRANQIQRNMARHQIQLGPFLFIGQSENKSKI
jgi:hypothetical protein